MLQDSGLFLCDIALSCVVWLINSRRKWLWFSMWWFIHLRYNVTKVCSLILPFDKLLSTIYVLQIVFTYIGNYLQIYYLKTQFEDGNIATWGETQEKHLVQELRAKASPLGYKIFTIYVGDVVGTSVVTQNLALWQSCLWSWRRPFSLVDFWKVSDFGYVFYLTREIQKPYATGPKHSVVSGVPLPP